MFINVFCSLMYIDHLLLCVVVCIYKLKNIYIYSSILAFYDSMQYDFLVSVSNILMYF